MAKLLFSTEEIVYRRLDVTYYEEMYDRLSEAVEAHPEWANMIWSYKVEQQLDGSFAKLYITATDPKAFAFPVSPGIVVALFVMLLVILSAVTGWGWE